MSVQTQISLATVRNWKRLGVVATDKLTSRANKRLSKKIILPTEYFTDKNNIRKISEVIKLILENEITPFNAIYTIAVNQLQTAGIYHSAHVQKVLSEYRCSIDNSLLTKNYPTNERDLLGLIYQCLIVEGDKNKRGSYYTPFGIVKNMTNDIDFQNDQAFLDPCCGSGSFLLTLSANPNQLFGIDNDPIAVFICKINLLLKYRDCEFFPQIFCVDYLQENSSEYISNLHFDYIITNPPWGALSLKQTAAEITSNEVFSCFFVKAYKQLKLNGVIRFLFPKSILSVKSHKDIRAFMLNNGNLDSITLYDSTFAGVTTQYVDIKLTNTIKTDTVVIHSVDKSVRISKVPFYFAEDHTFSFHNDYDAEIIDKIKSIGAYTLSDSTWALGIVTGDNKNKLLTHEDEGTEPIYTGKEIQPYVLKQPLHYIRYIRADFQQVAKEEYYRADEKLVYKFISNRLVFAYDNSRALFLNSANILIPNIPNMSIKTVLAFLNSELYQYLYSVLFTDIKILKGNLVKLPFPAITAEQDNIISGCTEKILDGKVDLIPMLQKMIYDLFGINEEQKKYIKEFLYGAFNK